jgi:hypothetical protein
MELSACEAELIQAREGVSGVSRAPAAEGRNARWRRLSPSLGSDRVGPGRSLDRAKGRRTWEGNRDRWLRGEVRSATVRCCRSGTARTRRRVRTATPWHRTAQCRPRPPIREQTCRGWLPIGQLPLLSRISRPPHGVVLPGTPANASHFRRRTRPLRPRHPLRPGAGHRGELDPGWRHPVSRQQRLSCRRGRHRQPRRTHHGALTGWTSC